MVDRKRYLIAKLSEKAGRDVATPAGSDWLHKDILSKTGENIGLNTVKRLTGVVTSQGEDYCPRRSTLDIIARYLNMKDWRAVEQTLWPPSSAYRKPDWLIELDRLPVGVRVGIAWDPDRKIVIRHLGEGKYEVLQAGTSKLREGDLLMMTQVMTGYPLHIREVIRGEESLGCYTAGMDPCGVIHVRVAK